MFRFKLPDIGEGVVEAELTRWCVKEGDRVAENQVLAELLTDKASIEIPSPKAGRIAKLHCREGEIVKVGAVLIEIDDGSGGQVTAKKSESESSAPKAVKASATGPVAASAVTDSPAALPPRPRAHSLPTDQLIPADRPAAGDLRAVPAVREYARSMQVDLGAVVGSGPGGRIMRRDIDAVLAAAAAGGAESGTRRASSRRAAAPPPPTATGNDPPDWRRVPLRGLRRTIAERMVRSKLTAPHFTYVEEIDMTAAEALRQQYLQKSGGDLSPLVLIARAVVRCLPDFPELNASLDDQRGEIILKGKIHLGMAVAVPEGLLVPVVADAGQLSTPALAAAIRDLSDRAREGKLKPAELKGSTFSISSLGKLGGVAATPIINPPEVAIVGVNAIRTLPRYLDGDSAQLQPRKIMNLSMSLDHRVVDGAVCARFVAAVKTILEAADFADLQSVME